MRRRLRWTKEYGMPRYFARWCFRKMPECHCKAPNQNSEGRSYKASSNTGEKRFSRKLEVSLPSPTTVACVWASSELSPFNVNIWSRRKSDPLKWGLRRLYQAIRRALDIIILHQKTLTHDDESSCSFLFLPTAIFQRHPATKLPSYRSSSVAF